MSTPIAANSPTQLSDVPTTEATKPTETIPTQAEAHTQLNASIISASIEVSINSQNEPLALLFKSAITGINEALKPALGENAIQNAVSQDNTPEGTAGRIVSLSTGFFEAYKEQHPGEDEATVLKNFMTTIRGGFEKGYNEASDILKGMGVLSGDIAGNIDKTHELVLKGYADFEAAHSSQATDASGSSTKASPPQNAA
jgi:hypothetical protein